MTSATDIDPFGILDKDLVKYLIGFHIGVDYIGKGESVPDNIVDHLVEKRREQLAQTRYREDRQSSEKNLEFILRQVVRENVRGHGRPKEVSFDKKPAISYEHRPTTSISKLQKRVKTFASYWLKSLVNVSRQNETGHYDHLALRIFIECEEARLFRMYRERDVMDRGQRQKYITLFGPKPIKDLTPLERERYLEEFRWEYSNLTDKEKRTYKKKWGEKHRQLCLDLAEKIADSVSWNTIPVRQHYGKWHDIPLRAQTQNIFSTDARKLASIDYLLFDSQDASAAFMRHFDRTDASLDKLSMAKSSFRRISDRLAIRFTYPPNRSIELENELYRKIAKRHLNLKAQLLDRKYTDDQYLTGLRLGLSDVPGLFIYAQTTTVDLEDKYPGFLVDRTKSREMFLKNYIGDKRKSNNYESVHVFISLDDARQIAFEIQIRDYIMHETAVKGSAAHEEYKKEKTKNLTQEQKFFGEAFFGEGEESNKAFDKWYRSHLLKKLDDLTGDIISKDSATRQDTLLERQMAEVGEIYQKACFDLLSPSLEQITRKIEDIRVEYRNSKGIFAVDCREGIARIDSSLRDLARTKEVGIKLPATDEELNEELQRHQLGALFDRFQKYAALDDPIALSASLHLGGLIKQYDRVYGQPIPGKTLREFSNKINQAYAEIVKANRWKKDGNSPLGYSPNGTGNGSTMRSVPLKSVQERIETDEKMQSDKLCIRLQQIGNRIDKVYESTRAYLKQQLN